MNLRIALVAFALITLFTLPSAAGPRIQGIAATPSSSYVASGPSGLIIPLYTYPGSTWLSVIQAKLANPSVPIIAIINPNNGPGTAQDPNYVSGVNELANAGVEAIGYVYTQYGTRSLSSVEADILAYRRWYNVSGIFFDEMSNLASTAAYYRTLATYANSLGMKLTVGNPGTSATAVVGIFDILVIYENQGLPAISSLETYAHSRERFAFISYTVATLNAFQLQEASAYSGWLYATNGVPPNPYDSLPPYFASEASALGQPLNASIIFPTK